jgi:hypothetical protein
MAEDIRKQLAEEYWVCIDKEYIDELGMIRHWQHIKYFEDDQSIWLRNLTSLDIRAHLLLKIPGIKIYTQKDNYLTLKGNLVPERKIPTDALWSPIDRALMLQIEEVDENIELKEKSIHYKLIPSNTEKESIGLLVDLNEVTDILEKTPMVRFENLSWTVIDKKFAFIYGTLLLPIKGQSFWLMDNFLLPSGYQMSNPLLAQSINEVICYDEKSKVILFEDNTYLKIKNEDWVPFNLASLRLTLL